jgi:hypothetical protein
LDAVKVVIKIIDNFFCNEDLVQVQNFALTKAFYSPRYLEGTKEKNHKNFYGNRYVLGNNPNLLKLFVDQAEKKFSIKIKKLNDDCSIDQRNLDHFIPHKDTSLGIANILIMIKGQRGINNGTVFFTEEELDIHVGFKENRAVMFPSDKIHSPHLSKTPNLVRYTSSLFIKDYEEE